jgi:Asp-tRNA(Asn)/Glu-tRNA(Gln) amidotransferase A subunit family amidase
MLRKLHNQLLTQTKAYVARILEVNSTLHMVTEINPDAWAIAKELDEERACGKIRGFVSKLCNIPSQLLTTL